jgi:hypothetical protein
VRRPTPWLELFVDACHRDRFFVACRPDHLLNAVPRRRHDNDVRLHRLAHGGVQRPAEDAAEAHCDYVRAVPTSMVDRLSDRALIENRYCLYAAHGPEDRPGSRTPHLTAYRAGDDAAGVCTVSGVQTMPHLVDRRSGFDQIDGADITVDMWRQLQVSRYHSGIRLEYPDGLALARTPLRLCKLPRLNDAGSGDRPIGIGRRILLVGPAPECEIGALPSQNERTRGAQS